MGHYAETRAWLCRRAIGLEGPSDPREVWRLLEWYGDCIALRQAPGALAQYYPRADGGADIQAPLLADERREAMLLLHEIGHWVNEGAFPRAPITLRLKNWVPPLEVATQRFVESFLLPKEAIETLAVAGDEWLQNDILALTGLEFEALQRRAEQCRKWHPPTLPEPWSSWGRFQIERRRAPLVDYVRIKERSSNWTAQVPADADLFWDLSALRPEELKLKYGRHQPKVEPFVRHWSEVFTAA